MNPSKLITAAGALLIAASALGQAKKPTLMVVPADRWCNKNDFMTKFDDQGIERLVPNYEKALQTDSDLGIVISKLGELMARRDFPLKDLEQSLKSLRSSGALTNMAESKSGANVAESPVDKLMNVAKCDIIMQIDYTINTTPRGNSVTFNLQGFDAYTNKQVAGRSGTGQPSAHSVPAELLSEAVIAHLDDFIVDLQRHFDDLFTNGREVVMDVHVFQGGLFDGDLETEFAGKELGEHLTDWMHDNTVQGRFGGGPESENRAPFEQVRIPLYDVNNRAVDTRGWARGLQKHLKDKFGVESKLFTVGLGKTVLILGEK